tara:strand:+ start:1723 stop:2157 length:435 start_codon:yes stop_codon:yes gene_type:complete
VTLCGVTEKKTVLVAGGVSLSSSSDELRVITMVTKVVCFGLSGLPVVFFVVGVVRFMGLVERVGELAKVVVTGIGEDILKSSATARSAASSLSKAPYVGIIWSDAGLCLRRRLRDILLKEFGGRLENFPAPGNNTRRDRPSLQK